MGGFKEWVDGWMGGWVDGWMGGSIGLNGMQQNKKAEICLSFTSPDFFLKKNSVMK